jgi:uncharacterized repeat protein (TIGR01451 family)
MRIFTLSLMVFAIIFNAQGQNLDHFKQEAQSYIQSQVDEWDLNEKDIRELKLVDAYTGSKSGVHHLYFIQRWNGTDIYNAITGIHYKEDGSVLHAAPKLYNNLEDRIDTYSPSISAQIAVETAARYIGIQNPQTQKMAALTNDIDQDVITFAAGNISKRPIPARLVYQEDHEGNLRLAWDLSIEVVEHVDWLSIRIDATNGALLNEVNWTVKCHFGDHHMHSQECLTKSPVPASSALSSDGASYNVFPFPIESPIYGSREIVNNPADSLASPYGWHDTNGDETPEFTITRGNNAHAFTDRNGDFTPDSQVDGGANLSFDFPFDQSQEPQGYTEAAATNLFYAINMMHDIAYYYGFDEAAGNFQATNYNGLGQEGDEVWGASQYDARGSSLNNANFATPPDGSNGSMRMFEWDNSAADQQYLEVIQPAEVRGFYAATTANFGEDITGGNVFSGNVVFAQDGLQVSTDACESINNGPDLNGNIVMIDRGGCDFSFKVFQAQQEGAVAVIICNNQGGDLVSMGAGSNGDDVEIPSIFISREDCNELRVYAGNTLEVEIKEPAPSQGADRYDGSLDNGIIAHEYAHGISNRLTGGPSAAGCLGNDEQMGEGWSDFFTLVTTVEPGDKGTDPRGIGNYVLREGEDGRGIRNFSYSTDMNINPQTYEDVILSGTAPHPLGEIWCVMLWDLYWALVDEYGFDPNIKDGQGGNNIAIQLVMEGMAIQACDPGFVDGRDAILAADEALYGGDNKCLIWEVFARRGLGVSADQGSTFDRRDAREAYDTPLSCSQELYLDKTVTPLIERGDTIEVTLTLTNYTSNAQESIVLTDLIPEGCSYIDGSANINPSSIDGREIKFDLPDMTTEETQMVTYELLSPTDRASTWIEEQDFNESAEIGNWIAGSFEGNDGFNWVDQIGVEGTPAFTIDNTTAENDHYLLNIQGHNISGEQPVMRFTHYYNTEAGTDGGIIEISTDGGVTFEDVGQLMFRNPYRGTLAYTTFAIVDQRAFWGDSEDFVTTYLDLSPYKGMENVLIRFRFGSVAEGGAEGWIIDDFHIFDMLNYNTEATVTFGDSGMKTTAAPENGTIVQPDAAVATTPAIFEKNALLIFPNPANELVHIKIPEPNEKAEMILFDLQGKKVLQLDINAGQSIQQIHTDQLSEGVYFMELIQDRTLYTGKLIKQ